MTIIKVTVTQVIITDIYMIDVAMAKNFEFKNMTDNWKGYVSSLDKTLVSPNVMVLGSRNMYKKLSGTLAVRQGQKRIGASNTTFSPVSSEFVWNTSWGATFTLWISDTKLQVMVDEVWYTLLSSLTSTRYVFDKWWDNTLKKDICLFVYGTDDMQNWGGGFALISSTTANTIVLDRTVVASVLPATGTVIVNGTTYTYSGSSASTLTGVSPTPVGEANGSGVLQAVATDSNTPASGFLNDFLKVVNNQVYVGSYTSRLCYISKNNDYNDFVVPSPRAPGDPELLTLDSTLNGISVKQGNAYISFGTDSWAAIRFSNITVGSVLTQQTFVDIKPVAVNQAAYAHEFIDSVGDNIVYLAQDQQVRTVGDFNNAFTQRYPSLSQEIATELSLENFEGGGLRCIGEFTYVTAPLSGKTYLKQVRESVDVNGNVVAERLWHSPFIWNATRVDSINGVVVCFSNANPQLYEVWDTNQWHDDSPSDEPLPYSCVCALAYRTGNRRQGMQQFDKNFTEGYITQGTELNLLVNYNYNGTANMVLATVNSTELPATLFLPATPSLGDSSLGDQPLGDIISNSNDINTIPKFKCINSLSQINCFEYQPVYYSDLADAQWEILAQATNAVIATDQNATFLINKRRNVL